VYAKNLILNRNVDNVLQFQFINQEQKPVDLTPILAGGKQITFRLLSAGTNSSILIQKALTAKLTATGIMELYVSSDDLIPVDPQDAYYSLEIPLDGLDQPVFVDAKGGARGVMRVVNSVLPAFIPSQEITIPSHAPNYAFYSSDYNSKNANLVVFQATYANFVGNINMMASTFEDFSSPYELVFKVGSGQVWMGNTTYPETVNTVTYTSNYSGTDFYYVEGFHPYIQFVYSNANIDGSNIIVSGDVVSLLAR
jgi:hypothetical protein